MSIEILTLGRFEPNDKAVNVALPVLAFECEATPPIENYLDAYEETVLKLVSIGLSSHGIAGTMNATESLIEEILDNLEQKKYVEKEIGRPWKVTDDGNKYLSGEIGERESDNSQFGYMFVNAIKKDVLPFFYQGDINQIALFRGNALPAKLTVCGDEEKTFEPFTPKRVKLKEAYRRYFKNADTSKQYDDGDITLDEAIDLFEGLDSFDEEEDEPTTLEDATAESKSALRDNMFIRALNCPPKRIYLTMRIIIDPQVPGGYRVESPFDFNGIDSTYFLRQIQWLAATDTTFLGNELVDTFLNREIKKMSPFYKTEEKDYSVFVLEKMPLLKVYKDRFTTIYDDMGRIYSLMQRQHSLLEKENIVNNISRSVVESLFNNFFRGIKKETLIYISDTAKSDLDYYGCKSLVQQLAQRTGLNAYNISWGHKYASLAIGRMSTTKGNSIVEKFINVIVLNYYLGTAETKRFLSKSNAQRMYDLADKLNQIRRKVSHDTDERFEPRDYDFYMANVFELINGLLEAYKED